MRIPRILFYAVNGLGLGHVTRLLAIARKVRNMEPSAEIIFLTSSEAEDVIYREGFAAFKVPSKTMRLQTGIRSATYARMLQTITLNLMSSFSPHILVVDTFPAGSIQELLPVLRWESRRVFVYREQRPEVAADPVIQGPLKLYDLAIVPHNPGEAHAPLPDGLDSVWTGPVFIRDRSEAKSRDEARAILGLPAEGPVVYITLGGGGDPEIQSALDGAVEALRSPNYHLAVSAGPLYRGAIVRMPGATSVDYYPMAELFPAFDAAVSAAGYNSAMELLHHGVPTAFVPFPRQVDDQEARAASMAQSGAGLCLPSITPEALRQAVHALLEPGTAAATRMAATALVPESGALRAAEAILALLPPA